MGTVWDKDQTKSSRKFSFQIHPPLMLRLFFPLLPNFKLGFEFISGWLVTGWAFAGIVNAAQPQGPKVTSPQPVMVLVDASQKAEIKTGNEPEGVFQGKSLGNSQGDFQGNLQKERISLKEAVSRAQESYAKARIAKSERNAQDEKSSGAWARLGPRVNLSFAGTRYEKERPSPSQGGNPTRSEETRLGSMTISQPITGLGALTKYALMESDTLDLKQDVYVFTKSMGAFEAAQHWLSAYLARENALISRNAVLSAEKQLDDAKALEKAGRINRGDVLKFELALSEAKLRELQEQNALLAAEARLREILDLGTNVAVEVEGVLPERSFTEISLEQAYERARINRLDIKIAQKKAGLASYKKSLAYSEFWPQVNLFVKADRNFGEKMAMAPFNIERSYGVNMTWDIWSGGSSVYSLRQAADEIVAADEEAKQATRNAMVEVQVAWNTFQSKKMGLKQAEIAFRQAEESFRIESARFKTGSRSAQELIISETAKSQAQGRLIAAKIEVISAHHRLEFSVGQAMPTI